MKKVFWREFPLLLFAGSLSASRSQDAVRFSTALRFTRGKISVRDWLLPCPDSLANSCPHLEYEVDLYLLCESHYFLFREGFGRLLLMLLQDGKMFFQVFYLPLFFINPLLLRY
jgi:hypothetical protein